MIAKARQQQLEIVFEKALTYAKPENEENLGVTVNATTVRVNGNLNTADIVEGDIHMDLQYYLEEPPLNTNGLSNNALYASNAVEESVAKITIPELNFEYYLKNGQQEIYEISNQFLNTIVQIKKSNAADIFVFDDDYFIRELQKMVLGDADIIVDTTSYATFVANIYVK